MKVVWICHFTNQFVQDNIRPWRKITQFAPWISNTIDVLKNKQKLRLHIISPHEYIAGVKHFESDGVFYYFFNPYIPLWGRHWPAFFKWDEKTNYAKNKRIVEKIIKKINPDIIHLQGAENPYYASTVLSLFSDYPVIVNLQRINFEALRKSTLKASIERDILQKAQYFSIRTHTMKQEIRVFRPDSKICWIYYKLKDIKPIICEKKYDIVYFAKVSKEKGIEDLLKSIGLMKQKGLTVSLCVIGSVNVEYKNYLLQIADNNGVKDSIVWKGYMPTQKDVHNEASKAKISVLPTKNDIIPGTIIESMQLGLPVVSYKVGSIPELNIKQETVLLSEVGDIKGLAANMTRLLEDNILYSEMSKRGIECIRDNYSNQEVFKQHLGCYKEVIRDFKQKGK